MALSRIDFVLGSESMLAYLASVQYLPRGLSDHSLMIVYLLPRGLISRGFWKLNPHGLTFMEDHDTILAVLKEYVKINSGTICSAMVWDSLKAFLRDHLVFKVNVIKKHLKKWASDLTRATSIAEQNYILNPSPLNS